MHEEQYQGTFFALDGRLWYFLAFLREFFPANVALYHNVNFSRSSL